MSIFDYLINIILVGLVIVQLRGKRISTIGFIWPTLLVLYFAFQNIHTVPTQPNDILLMTTTVLIGITLGVLSGVYTNVFEKSKGVIFAKATILAAVFWIVGMSARLVFELIATNGGGDAIGTFSIQNHLTAATVWTSALLFMALAEVVSRSLVLYIKTAKFQKTHKEIAE